MKWAGAARDDGSNLSGWLLASVAKHCFSIFPLLKEIWQLIISSTLPMKRKTNVNY
jgi:hypothetical protein